MVANSCTRSRAERRPVLIALLRDERGAEVVEWIGLGGLLVVLVVGIHLSLYGGGGAAIRAALTGSISRTALTFGGDTAAPIPRLPTQRFTRGDDPAAREGAYTIFDEATGEQAYIWITDDTQVAYDPASGRLQLTDDGRGLFAALNPLTGQATLIDPATGAPRGVGLGELEGLGLIEVGRDPQGPLMPMTDQLLRLFRGG